MKIREATPEDFTAVRRLLAASGLVHDDLTPAHLASFMVVSSLESPSSVVAVAGLEAFLEAGEGLLRSVAVAPGLRGQGMGASLVSAVEEKARALGLRRLWLLTITAPAFFRRLGYVDTERPQASEAVQQSGEFKNLCPASAICLSKLI